MGIIRSVLTADAEEIAVIRSAFDAKSTSEPAIKEQRSALSKPVPGWAIKMNVDTVFTGDTLDDLDDALTARTAVLESYPDGPKRATALERHRHAQRVVAGMRATLTGQTPGDSDHHNGDNADAHDGVAVGVGG